MKKALVITCVILILLMVGCDRTSEEKNVATSDVTSSVVDDIGNAAIFDSDNSDGSESTTDEGDSGEENTGEPWSKRY